MRKFLLTTMILSALAMFTFAQETEEKETNGDPLISKKGFKILPESGDIAIGVDAAPFVTLAGNMLAINNGGAAYNARMNFLDGNNTIYGKYFLDSKTAIRGKIRIGMNKAVTKAYVQDDELAFAPIYDTDAEFDPATDVVEDKMTASTRTILIGAGMEFRRGHNRLQGYYGGEALLLLNGGPVTKYEYGNEMGNYYYNNNADTALNAAPTNAFGMGASRTIKNKPGGSFGIGARGFIGVEYFFAPKMSIGGEFGWGFAYQVTFEGTLETESWNATDEEVETTEIKTAGNSAFNLDTDNNGLVTATVFLLFHF